MTGPSFHSEIVTQFELELTACVTPTVITPPTPLPNYTYTVGEAALDIVLTGGWTADNSLCSITVSTPTVTPTDTYAIFSFSADNLTTTVLATDLASAGTYTISTSAGYCEASTVTYNVFVTDPCSTATITIDSDQSTFPSGVGAIALTYELFVDSDLDLSWNTANDIVSSITGTDPCGNKAYEIWATSSDGLTGYDSAIFSETGVYNDPIFRTSTTDPAATGLYYFRLVAYYESYPITETIKDFIIEIKDSC